MRSFRPLPRPAASARRAPTLPGRAAGLGVLGALALAWASAAAAAQGGEAPEVRSAGLGPGTVVLPGLTYRVLRSGSPSGAHPLRSDMVTVRYEGRLQNGLVFSTSPKDGAGRTTFELQRLIPGWIAALQLMRPGDIWQISVPPYLAYGERGKDRIPPGSTLNFRIELISSAPHGPAPPAAPAR